MHCRVFCASVVQLAALSFVIAVTPARAWDEPLCALDETLSQPLPRPEPELFEPAMCSLDGHEPLLGYHPAEGSIEDAAARAAMARARELAEAGRPQQALIQLRLVEQAFPAIADRIALLRGDLLLQAEQPGEACDAYRAALRSPDSTVQALARVGRVHCMIRSGDRRAASELVSLMRRYPELPQALQLRLELAQRYEEGGDLSSAIRIYRDVDLTHPGSPVAARARERLGALADSGVTVRELSIRQQVDRAERLAQQGPMDMARIEVERLLAERLPSDLRRRVALSAAHIARIEGRWDDARLYAGIARGTGAPGDPELQDDFARAQDAARAAAAREREAAEGVIRRLRRGRPWARVPHLVLRNVIETGARAGLVEPVNEALAVIAAGRNVHPQIRFDAALLASGVGDDELVARIFESLKSHPRYRVKAQYHYARALERLGRWADAEREFLQVIDRDRSETRWYRMWAQQRLWSVHEAMVCDCGPDELRARAEARERMRRAARAPVVLASLNAIVNPDVPPLDPDAFEGKVGPEEIPPMEDTGQADLDALRARLEPIAEEHGEVYPWLARAALLLRLGERKAATDELHEAYLAWRHAIGRPLRRVGLEAVYRGAERPRQLVDWRTRRERRKLDATQRRTLAEIASALGDEGTAAGFIGWERVRERPRAFEPIVREVAGRYGLDPNLLLAVMRVESVYQPRIISNAGAVGLMQIMPRTGRLIANAMGRDGFTTADLLDPKTNIEFAAWYLASLIERWDGHLPLAIASYNGGPHNVRRWLRDHAETMPLDAFLERIPFSQTHRYVRRVLTHYAAYREQQGLPMQRLSTVLPAPRTDPVGF